MKRIVLFSVLLATAIFFLATDTVSARENWWSGWGRDRGQQSSHNRRRKVKRKPHFETTIVSGTIFDGSNNPINGDKEFEKVTVQCRTTTKTGDIKGDGTYSVSFNKGECKDGDTATVSAVTEEGTASKSDTVYEDPDEGPCGDLDIAIINVHVPEFGVIGGIITGSTSLAGYILLRSKNSFKRF
jgi:hypothetical protein